ncbi:hypothetical protein DENSPDRAFT_702634 [Dentipellis sp. KUC8613]|nr:hypothetical protein DENSPDRAFT_702634 [Dentipellis sp. KUC8613]
MATPNFFPSSTVRSANASPVVVRRRPKESQKGSLPIYSRPRPYGLPSPPHALRTRYPLKGRPRGKGAEGVYSRRHGVDEETKQALKQSEDHAQDDPDFFQNLAEYAGQLRQRAEKLIEVTTQESQSFIGIRGEANRIFQGIEELEKEQHESHQSTLKTRSYIKERDRELHEMQIAFRERRRADRQAGLR